jgi:hypothetical protein
VFILECCRYAAASIGTHVTGTQQVLLPFSAAVVLCFELIKRSSAAAAAAALDLKLAGEFLLRRTLLT